MKWLSIMKAVYGALTLKRQRRVVLRFIKRIVLLEEQQELQEIKNIKEHLKNIAEILAVLKNAGKGEAERAAIAIEMGVPLLQAQLEAMVARRAILSKGHSVISEGHETHPGQHTVRPFPNPPSLPNNVKVLPVNLVRKKDFDQGEAVDVT